MLPWLPTPAACLRASIFPNRHRWQYNIVLYSHPRPIQGSTEELDALRPKGELPVVLQARGGEQREGLRRIVKVDCTLAQD